MITRDEYKAKIAAHHKIKANIQDSIDDWKVTEVEDGYTQQEIDNTILREELAKRIVQWQIEKYIEDYSYGRL